MKRLSSINLKYTVFEKGYSQYDDVDISSTMIVEAKYRKVQGYEENPDICALPAMKDYDILKNDLTTLPRHYDPIEVQKMDAYDRKRGLKSIFNISCPLEHFYDVYEMINKCLFDSYTLRDCWVSENKIQDLNKTCTNGNVKLLQNGSACRSLCWLLFGLTGSGKSVSVKQVMSTIPTAIKHSINGREFLQIPILFATVTIGNLSTVLNSIATNLDEITDMGTFHIDQMKRAKVASGCLILKDWIKRYHIGMLIIDEAQFMDFGKGPTSIENLISVAEETGCSIGLIGNSEVVDKINKYPRLLSRIGGNKIEAKCTTETSQKFLRNLLAFLWKYRWTKNETPLTADLGKAIMSEAMYNVSVLKNLVIMIQFEAICNYPKKGITPEYVKKIADKYFSELQAILYINSPESDRRSMQILSEQAELLNNSIEQENSKMKKKALNTTGGKEDIMAENLKKFETVYSILEEENCMKNDIERAFRKAMKINPGLQYLTTVKILDSVSGMLCVKPKNHETDKGNSDTALKTA